MIGARTVSVTKLAYVVGWLLHAAMLLAGGALMVEWLTSTNEHFAKQDFYVALGELTTALVVLALCAAYAYVLLRHGFSPLAAFLFMFTYPLLGLILNMSLRVMAKEFAPATPEQAQLGYIQYSTLIVVICGLAVAGVVAADRVARASRAS